MDAESLYGMTSPRNLAKRWMVEMAMSLQTRTGSGKTTLTCWYPTE